MWTEKMTKMEEPVSSNTLFIRNLPYATTNEKLEKVFSDIGPIKQCFVVKEKDSETCRGFGYVRFSLREDALTAKDKVKSIDGRKVFVTYANRKPKKLPKSGGTNLENKNPEAEVAEPVPVKTDKTISPTKKKWISASTVVLTRLPENITFDLLLVHVKTLKHFEKLEYPVPNRDQSTAFVRFKGKGDAWKAVKKLNNKKLLDQTCQAVLQSQDAPSKPQWLLKKARLIVRNLSFKCTEADLRKTFEPVGEVTETRIPRKADGKQAGFGFVQFLKVTDAASAISKLNGSKILGRPVAVDWALSKNRYKTKDDSTEEALDEKIHEKDATPGSSEEGSDKDTSEEKSSTSSEDESGVADSDQDTDSGESEDEVDEDDKDSDMENSDDLDSDEEEKLPKPKRVRLNDVGEGKTLFIRNLSFDTEEEDLEDMLSEFGPVKYCRIVMDPNTDHSKGTAFVQFQNKENADECLKVAMDETKDGGLTLDGRPLKMFVAIPREKAQELKQSKKEKETKDKRNLHLVREGMIRPGTQDAIGLSPADLAKRSKMETVKRQKLKNPSIFISDTRLSVHNLPTNATEAQLRKIFLKSAGDKSANITECRIMRDMARVNSQGVGKSLGYAFINFTQHRHALQALRVTNNNKDLFGDKKRPIVEFSLENQAALNAKQKRLERQKAKTVMFQKKKIGSDSTHEPAVKVGKKKNIANSAPVISKSVVKSTAPKSLPSHWGPKVRHKARPSTENLKKKVGQNKSLTVNKRMKERHPKIRKRGLVTDDFDKLVNKYRNKLEAVSKSKKSKQAKWFD